jgi:hypothetical protein
MKPFTDAIIFTGHASDDPDREKPRFPEGMVGFATAAILRILLGYVETERNIVLISSLARGADIIAVESAMMLGIPVKIVLPQPIEIFKEHSPLLSWEKRFDDVLSKAVEVTILDGKHEATGEDYVKANEFMVTSARELADEQVLLAFWDGTESNFIGGTSHFVSTFCARPFDGKTVDVIDAKDLLRMYTSPKRVYG